MSLKRLFVATAALESGAAVGLIGWPSATVALLLGAPLDTSAALSLGRLAGAALLALAAACWLARHDGSARAARGLVAAMVVYNVGAVAVLGTWGLGPSPAGIGLWPAVVVHAAMIGWCVASLLAPPPRDR